MARTATFNIVVIYDSLSAALRVKEMASRLAEDLRPLCELNCEFWRFELLRQPEFRAGADADGKRADMVIVAANGHTKLADNVKSWFENLLPAKHPGHCALVALLDEDQTVQGEPPPLCATLQELCASANLDFFCQAGGWRPAELQYVVESVQNGAQPTVHTRFAEPAYENRFDSDFRQWGINE